MAKDETLVQTFFLSKEIHCGDLFHSFHVIPMQFRHVSCMDFEEALSASSMGLSLALALAMWFVIELNWGDISSFV